MISHDKSYSDKLWNIHIAGESILTAPEFDKTEDISLVPLPSQTIKTVVFLLRDGSGIESTDAGESMTAVR